MFIKQGMSVRVSAKHSEVGRGLSYGSFEGTLLEDCRTGGWDVVDVKPDSGDGEPISVYCFSITRIARKRVTKFERDLRAAFPKCEPASIDLALRIMRKEATADEINSLSDVDKLIQACYSRPTMHHRRMVALNQLLETHGVEDLGECHMFDGPPWQYLNVGDSYTPTVIWYRSSGRFYIRCYADIVEAYRLK